MAPGCVSKMQQEASGELLPTYNKEIQLINLDQIPLPSTPPPLEIAEEATLASLAKSPPPPSPPKFIYDTLDSFEVLEQTVRKQKRLARKKNTDMRMKVLLKRTFDLVCEIMDHENGFDDDKVTSPPPELPLPPVVEEQLLYKADLEINVKHNDYADDEYSASSFSSSIVPSSDEDEEDDDKQPLKRKHDEYEDEEEEEDTDEDEEENRTAPNGGRHHKSKRQKFTSENNSSSTSSKWCKDDDGNENESMFDDGQLLCGTCEPLFLHNLTNVVVAHKQQRQQRQQQNSNDDTNKHQKLVHKNSDSEL